MVIHQATSLQTKTDADDCEQNDRVRVDGRNTAFEAAARINTDQFLRYTVVWAFRYGDG